MIVQCPKCKTSYKIADDKVPASGARMVCSKCQHGIRISPPPPPVDNNTALEKSGLFDFEDDVGEESTGSGSDLFGSPDDLFGPLKAETKKTAKPKKREKPQRKISLFDDSDLGSDVAAPVTKQAPVPEKKSAIADLFADDAAASKGGMPDFDWDDEEDNEEPAFTTLADGFDFEPGLNFREGERLLSSSTRPAGKLPSKPSALIWTKLRRAGIFILFLLLLSSGGGYVALHPEAIFGLPMKSLINEVRGMLGMPPTDVKPPKKNPVVAMAQRYYELTTMKGERLLVVDGVVRNISQELQSFVRVSADVLSDSGDVLTSTTVYAGNNLNKIQLRTFGLDKITEKLQREFGNNLVNFNIGPGKKILFTAIFYPVPETYKKIQVRGYIPTKVR